MLARNLQSNVVASYTAMAYIRSSAIEFDDEKRRAFI